MEKKQDNNNKTQWKLRSTAVCCCMVLILIVLNSCQIPPSEKEEAQDITIELIEGQVIPNASNPGNGLPESTMQVISPTSAPAETNLPATLVWMSDTQGYSEGYPEIFEAMTNWVVNEREALNIQYVLHTGDVVDNYDDMQQWENANSALSILEGQVPLFVTAGNHDINGENQIYDSYLNFFGAKRFEKLSTFGGAYRNGRGRYDLINIGEVPVILMSVGYGMGYGVDDKAMTWMNEVLQEYSDCFAILCLHSYTDPDGSFSTDGTVLFEDVVKKNPNIGLVLCGHRHGVNHTAVQLDDNKDGTPDRTVYQLVADYQDESESGGGYLGLLTFDSAQHTISVKTYSPYLDDYNCYEDTEGLEEFVLPWEIPLS